MTMAGPFKIVLTSLLALSLLGVLLFFGARYQLAQWYEAEDPIIWLPEILAFEAEDRESGVRENAIVFVGSSSIRFWETLSRDMAPIPVIQRGFGGARLSDVTHYVDRIVAPYKPVAVILFAGTNDIVPGRSKTPSDMLLRYRAFVERVWSLQPGTPIFYIGITPSPSRWAVWPIARESNSLISAVTEEHPDLHFIDTSHVLLGVDGKPRLELYRKDKLHLSSDGYRAWTSAIRPRLLNWMHDNNYLHQENNPGRAP